jgi:hypothetical protein
MPAGIDRHEERPLAGTEKAAPQVTSVNFFFTLQAHHHGLGSAGPDDGQQ